MTNISYLINHYPKVSHSFIRREILALERQGFNVQRVSIRGWNEKLVDSEDIEEKNKTQYILKTGLLSLCLATVRIILSAPKLFFEALLLTLKMAKKSDKSILYHLIYLAESCKIVPWLKSHQSQHLHAHFGTNSAEIAMLTSKLSAIPYSFTVHGPEEFDKPQALGLNMTISQAKFVVAISSFGRSQLFRWIDFSDWNKVKIVHCGLEASFYNIPLQPLSATSRLVCVGRLCEQKGQLLLVEAAKKLYDSGVEFELILAGDGEMRNELEMLIIKYGLYNKIKITGWISSSEVRQYILASKVLVLPSFAEGLPVVIMEAMSLRRPVISTYIAGIPELVKSGENGWLTIAGDIDDLTNALQNALTTSIDTLKRMGDSAFDSVVARHNIDVEAAKLAQYIRA